MFIPILGIAFILLAPIITVWLAWRYSPLAHASNRPTWKRCAISIFAVMLVGIGFKLVRPVYLAPPQFQYTDNVYLGLMFLWIPASILCGFLRPTGFRFDKMLVLFFVGYVLIVIAVLVGPVLDTGSYTPEDCNQETSAGRVQYTCKHNFNSGFYTQYTQYTLQGAPGWPFVWVSNYESKITDNP